MQHYRVYKLSDATGRIIKGKDLFADDDREALESAQNDEDCPVCEVWKGTSPIGLIDGSSN